MSRIGAIFWLVTAMAACVVMFLINYAVQSLQDNLGKVRKQTATAELEIRVLHAEWSYLTQPERLAALNQQFLSLTPIATKQLQGTIADIPLRPVVEPPPVEEAAAAPIPASAGGLELSAKGQAALDALFAEASGQPQPSPAAAPPMAAIALDTPEAAPPQSAAPPATTVALDTPVAPPPRPPLPVTTVALTTTVPARPARRSAPELDALFAQVASER